MFEPKTDIGIDKMYIVFIQSIAYYLIGKVTDC